MSGPLIVPQNAVCMYMPAIVYKCLDRILLEGQFGYYLVNSWTRLWTTRVLHVAVLQTVSFHSGQGYLCHLLDSLRRQLKKAYMI